MKINKTYLVSFYRHYHTEPSERPSINLSRTGVLAGAVEIHPGVNQDRRAQFHLSAEATDVSVSGMALALLRSIFLIVN
jgi:hypothetical protein